MSWDLVFDKPAPMKTYSDHDLGPILRSDAALLGAIANYVQPKVVVEFGSLEGYSAAVWARFAEKLYCVEIDGIRLGLHQVAGEHRNVIVHNCSMRDWVPGPDLKIDIVYFDASHRFEDAQKAFLNIEAALQPPALVICHDTATWNSFPTETHENFKPVRDEAVSGEREFVLWLKARGWSPVAFGCRTAFRHGLTILQFDPDWEKP